MPTVTGTLESVMNIEVEPGIVEVALCGFGSQVPRFNGTALIARATSVPTEIPIAANGTFSFGVNGNDQISPAGTYYTVTIKDANGDIVQVNAYRFLSSPPGYNLNSLDPFDPALPMPPLPPLIENQLQVSGGAPNITCDGANYLSFQIGLNQNTAINITGVQPGNLYTFIVQQDVNGGHTFTWASNMHNATQVNFVANSTTTQTFVADENSQLWPIGPGTWS